MGTLKHQHNKDLSSCEEKICQKCLHKALFQGDDVDCMECDKQFDTIVLRDGFELSISDTKLLSLFYVSLTTWSENEFLFDDNDDEVIVYDFDLTWTYKMDDKERYLADFPTTTNEDNPKFAQLRSFAEKYYDAALAISTFKFVKNVFAFCGYTRYVREFHTTYNFLQPKRMQCRKCRNHTTEWMMLKYAAEDAEDKLYCYKCVYWAISDYGIHGTDSLERFTDIDIKPGENIFVDIRQPERLKNVLCWLHDSTWEMTFADELYYEFNRLSINELIKLLDKDFVETIHYNVNLFKSKYFK